MTGTDGSGGEDFDRTDRSRPVKILIGTDDPDTGCILET